MYAVEANSTTTFLEVDVTLIDPNPHQPRALTMPDEIRELADDIKVRGLLAPIVVTPSRERGRYLLVAGSRRLSAVRLNGMKTVSCAVRSNMTDVDLLENALIENIQRESLTDWEEAVAIHELMEARRLGVREVAKLISKSPAYVSKRLRVFGNPALNEAVRSGRISTSTAEELLGCDEQTVRSFAFDGVTRQQIRGRHKDEGADPLPSGIMESARSLREESSSYEQLAALSVKRILRDQGLGEIVARVRDYAASLKTALVDRSEYMDEKCWSILAKATAEIELCLREHEDNPAIRGQGSHVSTLRTSSNNGQYVAMNKYN